MVGLLSCCTTEAAPRVGSKDSPQRIPSKLNRKPSSSKGPAIGIASSCPESFSAGKHHEQSVEEALPSVAAASALPSGSSPSSVDTLATQSKPGNSRKLSEASTSAGTSPAGSDNIAEPLLASSTPASGEERSVAKLDSDLGISNATVEDEGRPLTPCQSGRSRGSDSSARTGMARRGRRRSIELIDGDLLGLTAVPAESSSASGVHRASLSPGAASSIMSFVAEREESASRKDKFSGEFEGRRKSMVGNIASVVKRSTTQLLGTTEPKKTLARRNSQFTFAEAAQTIIFFDWDDTLFPTTYLLDDMRLAPKKPMKQQRLDEKTRKVLQKDLLELQHNVKKLLEVANSAGKVVLVTLARSPWIDDACQNFFPDVGKLIKSMGLKIVYAQEGQQVDYDRQKMMASHEIELMYSRMKGKAIRTEVDQFYSMYEGQSWKNVISIGDSDFERMGTIMMSEDYLREKGISIDKAQPCASHEVDGHIFRVRTKTFKMMEEPMIFEVNAQVRLLQKWVPKMVALDDGLDVDLRTLDDQKVIEDIERKLLGRAGSKSPRSRTK